MSYRIVKEMVCSKGFSIFTISNDQDEYLRLSADEIIENDELLSKFPMDDIKQICYSSAYSSIVSRLRQQVCAAS